jgi:hypothetical protein
LDGWPNKKALTVGEDSQGLELPVTRKLYLKQQPGKIGEKTSLLDIWTLLWMDSSTTETLFLFLGLPEH